MDGTEDHKFDNGQTIDQVSDSLLGDLGLGDENSDAGPATPLSTPGKDAAADPPVGTTDEGKAAADKAAADEAAKAILPRAAPKSWPKEAHDYWGKLDPKVQDLVEKREADFHAGIEQYKGDAGFARALKEIIAPYQPLLDSQGIKDHTQGIRGLLNAHYQLSSADESSRTAFMANLLKGYRIDPAKLVEAFGAPGTDPALRPLTEQINNLTQQVTAQQRAHLDGEKAKYEREVEAFASDPAHPYFEEVAPHIVLLLRDPTIDLKMAYEQAVRANPATWAKEEVRLRKEMGDSLRKEADEVAAKARKARGTPVKGAESDRSPTDPLGSMDDTLKDTLKEIKNRITH